MAISRMDKYVNGMMNIGYLTGWVRHLDKMPHETWHHKQLPEDWHGFLLQQNGNPQQFLPISMPKDVSIPADKTPVTVTVHAFGFIDPVAGVPSIKLKSLDVSRPSIRALPPHKLWLLMSNQKFSTDDWNPFGVDEALKDLKEKEKEGELSPEEMVISKMVSEFKGARDKIMGQNSNFGILAGFLDSYTKFLGNEFTNARFWNLMLRQHADRNRSINVRVYTKDIKGMGRNLRRGMPLAVTGQYRVKLIPGENKDDIPKGFVYLRTDDIAAANRQRDILIVPDWYAEMMREDERVLEKNAETMVRMLEISQGGGIAKTTTSVKEDEEELEITHEAKDVSGGNEGKESKKDVSVKEDDINLFND